MFGDSLWALVVVGGFVVLMAAILYARMNNKTTPRDDARTEAATARNYDDQAAEDRAGRP